MPISTATLTLLQPVQSSAAYCNPASYAPVAGVYSSGLYHSVTKHRVILLRLLFVFWQTIRIIRLQLIPNIRQLLMHKQTTHGRVMPRPPRQF